MARIRSLKPSFFDNEDLAALSAFHRLAFQGLWLHADREGRLEDRPKRLKVKIFPYDDLDMNALLTGLAEARFIVRYVVAGKGYISIPTFLKHQRPKNDEQASAIPPPPNSDVTVTEQSLDSGGTSTVPRIGNRTLGNRTEDRETEGEGKSSPEGDSPPVRRADDLVELWNETTLPPIPRCRELTVQRRKKVLARLKERQFDVWRDVFRRIQASKFMHGQNDRGWVASFDWIVANAENAAKVLEGKYDDRPRGPTVTPMRIDAEIRARAIKLRQQAGRCTHDPRCPNYDACIGEIIAALRERQEQPA